LSDDALAALDAIAGESPDVLGIVDRELIIRYVNWVAPGLTIEAVVGHSVFNLVPPEYARAARDAFEKVLHTGSASSFETMYGTPNGLIIWHVRLGPIRVAGEVVGVFCINSDVTAQRREAADRDRFFSLTRDLLAVVAADGRITRVNPAFCELLEYGADEIEGKPFLDFLHPDDVKASIEIFSKLSAGHTNLGHFENRYRLRSGGYRVLSWTGIFDPLTDCAYGLARDVTDQRATEHELRHAQRMEAVGHLAGGIAHDFNNLLQAVLANVEIGLQAEPSSGLASRALNEIADVTSRASALTKQLLLFGRRAPLNRSRLGLNDLLNDLSRLLRRLLPESITIVHRLSADVGKVNADSTQLEQVVINLCVNARDAMDSHGTLTISTDLVVLDSHHCELHPWATPGPYSQLQISDNGAGMSPETRERVFDPFFTTKDKHRGTGLGLATVYAIVRQHGGLIHVQSELGQGSTFTVQLPCVEGPSPSPRPDPEQDPLPACGNETILVAEDDDLVRRPLIRALTQAGYHTLAATHGQQAVELFRQHADSVALVVLDVVMPQESGPEAFARMQEIRPDVPVIFISGYADPHARERLPENSLVLEKPFRTLELQHLIRKKLDG